jgi:hypothetical protein
VAAALQSLGFFAGGYESGDQSVTCRGEEERSAVRSGDCDRGIEEREFPQGGGSEGRRLGGDGSHSSF